MELLEKLEPNKDKITKMLKEYFDNSFIRFLEEYGIIDDKIDYDFDIKFTEEEIKEKLEEN